MELEKLSARQFEQFRDFIYKKSGIRVDERKIVLLSNRIRRRLKVGKFADFDEYFRSLNSPSGAGELENFLDAITTNETFFFRTAQHFDWLKTEFISKLSAEERNGQRKKTVRIWSAGCATGAEPYTIAICLTENMFRLKDWEPTIVATDISEQVLRDARNGIYKQRAVESVSKQQLRRFFRESSESDTWTVKPELKKMVRFENHNLLVPFQGQKFDCVFIRNVLIYFDRESKQKVIRNLIAAVDEGGYLVVGPSEGVYDMLAPLKKQSAFLYQKVE